MIDKAFIPEIFMDALKKHPKALDIFMKLPPSHQKEYTQYISEAKKAETQNKRIDKCIEMIVSKSKK